VTDGQKSSRLSAVKVSPRSISTERSSGIASSRAQQLPRTPALPSRTGEASSSIKIKRTGRSSPHRPEDGR
jgi:hypothetical protein